MAKKKVPETVAEWALGPSAGNGAGGRFAPKHGEQRGMAHIKKEAAKTLAKALKLRYVDHLTLEETATLTGMSIHEIRRQIAPFKVLMENPEEIKLYKQYEGDILDAIKMKLTQGMLEQVEDDERRKTMDFSRLSWAFGTIFDKLRLHRGESTSNVMTLSDLVKQAHARPIPKEDAEDAEIVDVPAVVEGTKGA